VIGSLRTFGKGMFRVSFFTVHQAEFGIVIHVALAMLLGAMLGIERESKDKPAGLRTHMLVAGAAALLVLLSDVAIRHLQAKVGGQLVQSDPVRIIEAVITGVSFLGAGTIIRSRSGDHVEGLTTAASLLAAAAIGICVALYQIVTAVGIAVLVLITLHGMHMAEKSLTRRSNSRE
jgi:putative Mg2+ transporter-C (MgtC) family protein